MKRVVNTQERHIIRFFFCFALILNSSLTLTSTVQAIPTAVDDPPENQLIYKTFGVTDPYTDPVPLPCDPEDENAHCDQDATPYYKPNVNPTPSGRSDLEEVTTPGMWPYTPTVKIISHWPSGETTACSGMLVDAKVVLTAAQCVYTHQPEHCTGEDAACWVDDLEAIPAYDNGEAPYGESSYETILTWTAWIEGQNSVYDLAAVQLRYPIGASLGWLGIGFNTNDAYFNTDTFSSTSYPEAAPYNGGTMAEWPELHPNADSDFLSLANPSDSGQIGASLNGVNGVAYGVLDNPDAGGNTTFTRITYEKFVAIRTFIEVGQPKYDYLYFFPAFWDF